MDFEKYKIKINIKSCCLFEQLSGKSFFKMDDNEDVSMLLYCSLIVNNDIRMTYKVFQVLLQDKKVIKWLSKEYKEIMDYMGQFSGEKEEDTESESGETQTMTLTDIAASLIVRYGLDANYVMYNMELWELEPYFKAADEQVKTDLVTQRFWTYLTILPHVDGKKIKSPDDLCPFEWEKESKKKKTEKDLKDNMYAVKHTIGMNINDLLNRKNGE